MEKIINSSLILFSKAVGIVSLLLASAAVETVSFFWIYEPEMPAALMPKDGEESV
jgi:cyclic lactone autoinducer peptide